MPADRFLIKGAYELNLATQPSPAERLFQYDVVLIQTTAIGACYIALTSPNKLHLEFLIGSDARSLPTRDLALVIAAMDASFGSLCPEPDEQIQANGSAGNKATQRAAVVVNEVSRIMPTIVGRRPRVVVVGTIGNIITALETSGYEVRATDLDASHIGQSHGSVKVENGHSKTLSLIGDSDVAVVTGMTLATCTLEEILQTADDRCCRVVLVAETGAWLGREYCDQLPVAAVVADPFPFYIFPGVTKINVFRKMKP